MAKSQRAHHRECKTATQGGRHKQDCGAWAVNAPRRQRRLASPTAQWFSQSHPPRSIGAAHSDSIAQSLWASTPAKDVVKSDATSRGTPPGPRLAFSLNRRLGLFNQSICCRKCAEALGVTRARFSPPVCEARPAPDGLRPRLPVSPQDLQTAMRW